MHTHPAAHSNSPTTTLPLPPLSALSLPHSPLPILPNPHPPPHTHTPLPCPASPPPPHHDPVRSPRAPKLPCPTASTPPPPVSSSAWLAPTASLRGSSVTTHGTSENPENSQESDVRESCCKGHPMPHAPRCMSQTTQSCMRPCPAHTGGVVASACRNNPTQPHKHANTNALPPNPPIHPPTHRHTCTHTHTLTYTHSSTHTRHTHKHTTHETHTRPLPPT